jgi:formiminotetrahydrofolate cyclodeaminase
MLLIEKSLKDYVAEVASGAPVPGGGSVAALAGSLGAALASMVGNLTIGRKGYIELDDEIKKEMDDSFEKIQKSIEILNGIVDEDSKAFDRVMEAFKMPKETEEEKAKRSEAIQEGYKVALQVPLRCAEECLNVLRLQKVFAEYGNKNAISDVGVGALLAAAALESALLNVRINLNGIKDVEFKKKIEEKIDNLMNEGMKLKDQWMKIVYEKMAL